ncbi:MAG: ATPase/protein kinase family protein [Myxococcales bacterium]|nr:ATPase/protein kinase family protein [Myxococcales bacterium]
MGSGGMGVVYQALDRERNQVVALKTLRDVDAAALVRFKREFRSLADISHPNLVSLFELISAGDRLFFTMELVSGYSFLRWVRRGEQTPAPDETAELSAAPESATDVTSLGKRTPSSREEIRPEALRGGTTLDLGRLRSALPQLAAGVAAIHDRGLLHRDLKPSNILVTTDGRVKILDFGLVTELDRENNTATVEGLAGTAAYMSPEQGARQPLGPPSDWYAVGVVLYEALTGRLPFVGGSTDVLMDKQRFEPPRAREIAPDAPPDLDELCQELLRRDPEARPNAREVLRRLGVDTGAIDVSSGPSTRSGANFIGRGRQMTVLADAFLASRRRLNVVFVHGRSGMGKSALIRRFLDGIEERDDALVVTGRCYERESVPYKAVDSVIDALSQYLARLPRLEAEGLMPRDVPALARLFPALRQVEAVTAAPRRAEIPDPQELRRRAFGALRELLARLADRRPLVLAIDDLQWGDGDSAALLAALVRPPDAPALLFIASHRSEDEADNAFLRHLRAEMASPGEDVRDVEVGPLDPLEATSLAQAFLGDDGAASYAKAARIAEESAGNPFFIDELARHVREGDGDRPARISLDEVLRARLRRLPPDAARLLAVIATAGRPIALTVAQRAAEVHDPALLALLKAGNLVRTRGTEPTVVECFHDRIREAQLALLDKERARKAHMRLAIALESSPRPDAEALAVHFAAAGEPIRAAEFASEAASRAAEALAFDRAARLYRLAIELTTARVQETSDLERTGDRSVMRFLYAKLGDALANAGRGAEAAAAYLQATARAPAAEVLELRRRAATQLLLSGHFSDGIAAMRDVLTSVGMRFTETPSETLAALLWRRTRIRLRGLGYKRRDVSQIPQEQLTRIDVADAAATGLGMVDSMRAASFQAQHLLLALEAGEPRRVARALSAEACFYSMRGIKVAKRTDAVLSELGRLADELDTAEARAQYEGSLGIVAFQHGHWARCLEHCQRAETIFRDRLTGYRWELSTTQIFAIYAESLLGRLRAFMRRLPAILKEADERGDLYTQTVLETAVGHTAWLTEGQPAKARQQIAEAIARWNVPDSLHLQHFNAMMSEVTIDVYNGDGVAGYERIAGAWKPFERSLLLYVQTLKVSAHFSRGRAALAATRAGRKGLLRGVARDARMLQGQKVAYGVALGTILEAGAALLSGDRERAAAGLRLAAERCDKVEMALHADAARWELGRVIGGDEGADLVAAAEGALRAEGVRDPAAMVATFTGGLTR